MGDTIHGNKYGGDHVMGDKIVHHAGRGEPGRGEPEPPAVILLMSANPSRNEPLRLDEERRQIDHALVHAQARSLVEVRTADAVRLGDLQNALLRHRPAIAHFSGHGTESSGIVVTDDRGHPRLVPPAALSELIRILQGGLRCVFLNACYTEEQARAIAEHVPCVGMHRRVLDQTAIRFAAGFYQGVAHGRTIQEAFDLGRNALRIHGHADGDAPRLLAAAGSADRPVLRAR
ncbi:hypothetical protein F4553_008120 [Allocatelliglobosispora scoriae]|uniref:CHAT domain-containing protein n=1 Tax=Allocatelliglobosispora scoriae TaxID=643052 RepID=A0A841C4F5_9ACTN|nr:CHAT domain-containing protein [Allocatelliglobosispora scoriae]MBB5874668.1 hypothetical protein [Allocatelliglobosispora scoriae]